MLRADTGLHRFARFFFVGVGSAMGYILIATALTHAGVEPWLASGLTYFAFIPVAYALQRSYAFRSDTRHRDALPRYLLVQAAGQTLSVLLPYLLAPFESIPPFAVFVGVVITVGVVSYVAMSVWTFKARFSPPTEQ